MRTRQRDFACSAIGAADSDRQHRIRRLYVLLAGTTALALNGGVSFANPSGGNVTAGAATIRSTGGKLTVRQTSDRAIISWNGFSIGAGQTTRFVQPSAASAVLNRVTGSDLSAIQGKLQSNGKVYLLNPNGVVVGPNGRVDTAAFIASTLNVSDSAFLGSGSIQFDGESTASIVNLGIIRARTGDVVLVATKISNQGAIAAPNGTAALAAGGEVLYAPDDGEILVKVPASVQPQGAAIDNKGTVDAAAVALKAAGSVYALAINLGGQVSATSVGSVGGDIVLDAGNGDAVVSGGVTARNGGTGGNVQIAGNRVALTGTVDASGRNGGGTVAIGGGAHGADPAIRNAADTLVTKTARITADATMSGKGGSVTVWSDDKTRFDGKISAKGGAAGGDGGRVEVSGKGLGFAGKADLTAAKGKTGALLLDPDNITIVAGNAAAPVNAQDGLWEYTEDPGSQTISVGAVKGLLAASSLTLQATGTITVNAAIQSPTASFFELDAPRIAVNASMSLPNGVLSFYGGTEVMNPGDSGTHTVIGQSLTSTPGAALSAGTIFIGDYDTVALAGRVSVAGPSGLISVNNSGLAATSFSATNASNTISSVEFFDGAPEVYSGNVDIANASGTLTIEGKLTSTAGHIAIVSNGSLDISAADVTKTKLTAQGGQITLASTGGAFVNDAGAAVFGGTGRRIIYTSTDDAGFSDGGLGYTHSNFVTYPGDPHPGTAHLIYVANPSGATAMTITADSFARLYGQADPAFTATYSGGSATDLTASVKFRIGEGDDGNVGTYTIVPYGAASNIHTLTYIDGTLTVNPAPLLITANDASRIYGAANPSFTYQVTGLVNGDTVAAISGVNFTTGARLTSNVGDYTVTPTGGTASNYTLSYAAGTLSVTKAPLTVIGNLASRDYGDPDPTLSYAVVGLRNGDSATVVSGVRVTTDSDADSPVGIYRVIVAGGTARNYALTYDSGQFVIDPATLTITADDASRIYGAADPSFTYSVSGLKLSDTAAVVSGVTVGTAATAASGVGSYAITATGGTAANYVIVSHVDGTLTVDKAALVITASDASRAYGAGNPTFGFTAAGLVNGDSASVVSGLQYATNASAVSGVGTYVITPSGGAAANYALSYQPGALTVTQASLIITANSISRTYGSANPAFTANYAGLVNGDSASVVSGLSFSTPAVTDSTVGIYRLTPQGASAANYAISYATGLVTVTPAPVTVTASDASRVYGGTNPSFTFSVSGMVLGQTVLDLQQQGRVVVSTAATSGSSVGQYAITASGGGNGNYAISFAPGTLSITPAPLTIIATDASRLYGGTDPGFGFSAAGLVNGDTAAVVSGLQFATSADKGSGVGTYSITASGGSAANYALSYQTGTLTITPAPLMIAAVDATRSYGAADPDFGYTATGLLNGDTVSVVSGVRFSTSAVADSGIGSYTITASGGSAANYALSYQTGTLGITPAPVTVTVDDSSRLYGQGNPQFTYGASGLVLGQTAQVLQQTGNIVFSTAATTASSVGGYAVTASGGGNPNYAITYAPGTLTVTPAPLFVTATGSKVYGDTLSFSPAFLQVTGLMNGDQASIVSGVTLSSAGAAATANAGSYTIAVTGGTVSDSNYTLIDGNGTLTVTPAPLVIVPDDKTWTLPGTQPALTYTTYGLQNGDPSSMVSGVTLASAGLGKVDKITHDVVVTTGDFDITASGGTIPSGNYVIVGYQNGVLHIVSSTSPDLNTVNQIARDVTFTPAPDITVNQNKVTVNPVIMAKVVYGPALGGFGPEAGTVIDGFLKDMTSGDPPVTQAQVIASFKDPKTSTAMMGLLMPYLMTDLDKILNLPESSWTDAQKTFVNQMTSYIQAQRQAAAQKAQADYEAWAKAQVAAEEETLKKVPGTAAVYEAAILSSNPPVPPPSFLQEVQNGMVMNLDQAGKVAGMNAQMGALGEALKVDQSASTVLELAGVGFQFSGNGTTSSFGVLKALSPRIAKTLLPFGRVRAGGLRAVVQGAEDAVNTVTTTVETVNTVDKGVTVAKDAEKTVEVVDAVVEAVSLASKVGRVLSVAGVVAEVAGNVLQIGISSALYAQAADYNNAFKNAVDAANKPVTVADLKAMMSSDSGMTQVATYMQAALATGTPDPYGNPLTTAAPTMPLASILTITSKF